MTLISPHMLAKMADILSPFIAELGQQVMDIYNDTFDVERKADNSPFTIADTLTEQRIVQFLQHYTPEIPIYAEESFIEFPNPAPQTFWLVDPIDGTKGFIKRNNYFTINIGLVHNNRPVFGIIHEPKHADTFIGFHMWGKTHNIPSPHTIQHSFQQDLSTHLIKDLSTGLSTAYKNGHKIQSRTIGTSICVASNADITQDPMQSFLSAYTIHEVLSYTSSIKICMIADATADLYPRFGRCYEWDTCAGDAILRGAGGMLMDMQGAPLVYGKPKLLNTAFVACGHMP